MTGYRNSLLDDLRWSALNNGDLAEFLSLAGFDGPPSDAGGRGAREVASESRPPRHLRALPLVTDLCVNGRHRECFDVPEPCSCLCHALAEEIERSMDAVMDLDVSLPQYARYAACDLVLWLKARGGVVSDPRIEAAARGLASRDPSTDPDFDLMAHPYQDWYRSAAAAALAAADELDPVRKAAREYRDAHNAQDLSGFAQTGERREALFDALDAEVLEVEA